MDAPLAPRFPAEVLDGVRQVDLTRTEAGFLVGGRRLSLRASLCPRDALHRQCHCARHDTPERRADARQAAAKSVLDTFTLAIGVKKDEKRLLEEVDKWIATNLKNGKLDAIYKKYHGNGLPDVILNQ